jgi:hypothetical protein
LGRLAASEAKGAEARCRFLFERCLGRAPARAELTALLRSYRRFEAAYGKSADEAMEMSGETLAPDADTQDLATCVATARVVLNLDEFITRE